LISVAFGEAARRVALVAVDEVAVMDLLEGRTTALRNPGVVADAAFSPNEECMLTIPTDGRIRLWEAKSGRQMTEFSARAGSSSLATFSDDSQMVVVSTGDTAQIFASDACATLDAMMSVARSRIVRPLGPEERRRFLHDDAGPTQR
jgi:WD40 repeat protein